MSSNKKQLDRRYISPYDTFLNDLRQKLPESRSQKKERLKHEPIFDKRDNAEQEEDSQKIWTDF